MCRSLAFPWASSAFRREGVQSNLPQGREEQVDHSEEGDPYKCNPSSAKSDDRLIEAMALSQISSEGQTYEGGGEEGEHEEPALVGIDSSAGQLEGNEENQGDQGKCEG